MAGEDADAVQLGIETEGCDDAETEGDVMPLRESAMLADAHADARLEAVGSGVADIGAVIEAAAVAPGDAETRGDSLAFTEIEKAGESVPVAALLVDGLADLEIVGDASVEAESVPECVLENVGETAPERVRVETAVLRPDADPRAVAVESADPVG